MPEQKCGSCSGKVTDTTICWRCVSDLRILLVGADREPGLDWFAARLAEAAYGQARVGARGKRAPGEAAPMPLNVRASNLRAAIARAVAQWHIAAFGTVHGVTLTKACRRLAAEPGTLMGLAAAPSMLRAAEGFGREALRLLNRPPDVYLGPCPAALESGGACGTELWAEDDAVRHVSCRRCNAVHDVDAIRQRLLDRVDAEPQPAATLLRILRWTGRDIRKSDFYDHLKAVPPRVYAHPDGQRNLRRGPDSVALYAWGDVVQAIDGGRENDEGGPAHRTRRRPRRAAS